MSIIIREKESEAVLAEAQEMGKDVINYENNLYFDPGVIVPGVLQISERTYTCPYKGTCQWVDYHGADGKTVNDVGWVYADPKPGHEAIKNRYGFYAGNRGPTTQEG